MAAAIPNVPKSGRIRVRVVNQGRYTGGWFQADLEIDGVIVGRVERGQTQGGAYGNLYRARVGGTIVGSETRLADTLRDVASEENRAVLIDALAELAEAD